MEPDENNTEATQTLARIRELWILRMEAKLHIEENLGALASAKESLRQVVREPKTDENASYLPLEKKAWRASIVAHKASVEAFQQDIEEYELEVGELVGRIGSADSSSEPVTSYDSL